MTGACACVHESADTCAAVWRETNGPDSVSFDPCECVCHDTFPCAGYSDCLNVVNHEDGVCLGCQQRDESANAGGCPGCGGHCVTACR